MHCNVVSVCEGVCVCLRECVCEGVCVREGEGVCVFCKSLRIHKLDFMPSGPNSYDIAIDLQTRPLFLPHFHAKDLRFS